MWRSTSLCIPFQLVFPGMGIICLSYFTEGVGVSRYYYTLCLKLLQPRPHTQFLKFTFGPKSFPIATTTAQLTKLTTARIAI